MTGLLYERLNSLYTEKREGEGFPEVCPAHDLSVLYERVLGVEWDDNRDQASPSHQCNYEQPPEPSMAKKVVEKVTRGKVLFGLSRRRTPWRCARTRFTAKKLLSSFMGTDGTGFTYSPSRSGLSTDDDGGSYDPNDDDELPRLDVDDADDRDRNNEDNENV